MMDNPLIQRYRASHLRLPSLVVYLCVYAVVVVLIAMMSIAAAPWPDISALRATLSFIFFYLAGIQVVLLWGWGAYNSAQTIRLEHERKSYDFFRLLPLSAREKAVGILIGRNLPVLVLVAVNSVLMLLTAPNQLLHGQMQCIIWSGAALLCTVALLSSCSPHIPTVNRRGSSAGIVIVALFLFQWVFGLCYSLVHASGKGDPLLRSVPFGPGEIPIFLAVVIPAGVLAAWCYAGILRRLTVEDMPLFSRKGAVLFASSLLALLLCFLGPRTGGRHDLGLFGAVLVAGFVGNILILLGSLKTSEQYLESCRRAGATTARDIRTRMASLSNLGTAAMLLAVHIVALVGMIAAGCDDDLTAGLDAALGMVLAYAFAALLVELHALYKSPSRHVTLLASFAAVLYIIVPLVFSAVTESEIALISGVNYMVGRMAEPEGFDEMTIALLVGHALLLSGMYIAVGRRVRQLAEATAAIG